MAMKLSAARAALVPYLAGARLRPGVEAPEKEYAMRVGIMAASAVHEIASPLCTLTLLVDHLMSTSDRSAPHDNALRLLADQARECRRIVSEFMSYAGGQAADADEIDRVDATLARVVDKWQRMRPGVELVCDFAGPRPAPMVEEMRVLGSALLNLLNNAADVSPQMVELQARWTKRHLSVRIRDHGPGIPEHIRRHLGEAVVPSTKGARGNGAGVLFAKIAIQAAGGALTIVNRERGGVDAQFDLPLKHEDAVETTNA
jgi:two-component system sensor histidine kinase RegB